MAVKIVSEKVIIREMDKEELIAYISKYQQRYDNYQLTKEELNNLTYAKSQLNHFLWNPSTLD